jgi:hypothetical protein
MARTKWLGWRSAVFPFAWMFVFFLAASALHKLHVLGQPIAGLVIHALGAGVVFALFSWLASGAGDTPSN